MTKPTRPHTALPLLLALAVIVVAAACSNSTSPTNQPPSPRDILMAWLNENLPDVAIDVDQGSNYELVLLELAVSLESAEAFVNYNLGILDIRLGVAATYTIVGVNQDTLVLPGDGDVLAIENVVNSYVGAIFYRFNEQGWEFDSNGNAVRPPSRTIQKHPGTLPSLAE